MSRKSLCSLVREWALCFLPPLYQKYWLALTLILRLLYLSYIEGNLVSEIKVYINLGIRVSLLNWKSDFNFTGSLCFYVQWCILSHRLPWFTNSYPTSFPGIQDVASSCPYLEAFFIVFPFLICAELGPLPVSICTFSLGELLRSHLQVTPMNCFSES